MKNKNWFSLWLLKRKWLWKRRYFDTTESDFHYEYRHRILKGYYASFTNDVGIESVIKCMIIPMPS